MPKQNTDFRKTAETFEQRGAQEGAENILEGRNPIREALKAGRTIELLVVAKGDILGPV